jgi:hypothetical protein
MMDGFTYLQFFTNFMLITQQGESDIPVKLSGTESAEAADEPQRIDVFHAKRGLYAPCPCGSGRKFRFCQGQREGTRGDVVSRAGVYWSQAPGTNKVASGR